MLLVNELEKLKWHQVIDVYRQSPDVLNCLNFGTPRPR